MVRLPVCGDAAMKPRAGPRLDQTQKRTAPRGAVLLTELGAVGHRIETIKPFGVTTTQRPFCCVMVSTLPMPGRLPPGLTS